MSAGTSLKALATRRKFLAAAGAVAAMQTLPYVMRGEMTSNLALDAERPQFHLLPASNWMNDPNGPIYWNGRYHMFFQYNPHGATWGNMSWNHAVSLDMMHWTHLPLAMTPTPKSADSFGVFSGTALKVGKRVYFVYTGAVRDSAKATIMGDASRVQESQCLAWSDDPKLVNWTKDPQPVIPMPPPGMKITGFRDPSPWKQGDWYYLTVGSGEVTVGGCVLLYRSKDLKQWEYLHKLTSGEWNHKPTENPCDDGEMWECPDFFALDSGHVLIYSTMGKVYWQSGKLDEATMLFHPEKTGLLDFDAFYAPKTQLDAKGRRILWGWIPERRSEAAMKAAGWSGIMSLPRVLTLDKDGTLRIRSLPQLSALRGAQLHVTEGKAVLAASNGEVLCVGGRTADFSLILSVGKSELVRVSYSASRRSFRTAGDEIKLEVGDIPSIHLYADGSVLELILGQRVGCTKRFYFGSSAAPDLMVQTTGAPVGLDAWSVKPISGDRLTTPAIST